MSQELKNYLVELATDLDRLSAFISDPGKAAQDAGLSDDDHKVLLSGDQNRIYAAVASPAPEAPTQTQQQSTYPTVGSSQPIAYLTPWGQWVIYILAVPQSAQAPPQSQSIAGASSVSTNTEARPDPSENPGDKQELQPTREAADSPRESPPSGSKRTAGEQRSEKRS